MIDTIILSIPKAKTTAVEVDSKIIPPWDLQARTSAYDKFVKNPPGRELQNGLYFPRLTGYNRHQGRLGLESVVRIEFSAPKLLYKNNLDELEEGQFPAVVEALRDRLGRMGIIISAKDLTNASVTAVHYSKNIELQGGYTAQYVIGELGKINLNKRFDFTRARYMNDGQSLYAYTMAHSFTLYDKIADLRRGQKKAMDKEQPVYQLNLFERLNDKKEILRCEVRLSQKRKMNALFKRLGFPENPTFQEVFSSARSKEVLTYYWETMIANNGVTLFAYSLTAKDLLKQILLAQKYAKGKNAIYLTGLVLLAKEGNGLRELRTILAKRTNDRSWYRIADDFKGVTAALQKLRPREWYEQIRAALRDYQPYRIRDQ